MNTLLWAGRLGRLTVFAALIVVLYFAYRYSIRIIIHGSWAFGIIVFWAITAYVTIPRIHRQLHKIYLPDYFIGRTRTADGLLHDPVNIAVLGSARELRMAMESAGWVQAEPITIKSTIKIILATAFRRSYPSAPVSSMFLFSQRQTFAFQKELDGDARQRHHVRFWKTPAGWWLPGGHDADWVGSASLDTNIGLSLFTGQFTHRIAENIDEERDFVVESMRAAVDAKVEVVQHFASGYHGRNGGGDRMRTDGAMPFVDLRNLD